MEEINKQKEFQSNKLLQLVFLRKFLSIYFAQILFVGLFLIITLYQPFKVWLLNNSWFCYVGFGLFFLLIIPMFFGVSRMSWPSGIVMSIVIISLFMIFSYICVKIGNPFGIISYFALVSAVLMLLVYSLAIQEEFNFIIAFIVSMIIPVVLLAGWSIYSNTHHILAASIILGIAFYMLVINYSAYLHISEWLEGGSYKEDEIVHPALRLHYDFFMLFLKMIKTCREKAAAAI